MKNVSIPFLAQFLVLSACTHAVCWNPLAPMPPEIPKIDPGGGLGSLLIYGIVIIFCLVAIIFVYRLLRWIWQGIKDLVTDFIEMVKGLWTFGQKHDVGDKMRTGARKAGQYTVMSMILAFLGLQWLWGKMRGKNNEEYGSK